MVLRQAESEVRGQGKEGAKIVVCVVHETTRVEEELGLQIRGFKRSRPKTEGDPLLAIDGDERTNFQGWRVDPPSALGDFSTCVLREIDDTVGDNLSTLSALVSSVTPHATFVRAWYAKALVAKTLNHKFLLSGSMVL